MIDIIKPQSETEYGYLMRVYSTRALTQLWEMQKHYTNSLIWVGMIEFESHQAFALLSPKARVERINSLTPICKKLVQEKKFHVMHPWMHSKLIVANRGTLPDEIPPSLKEITKSSDIGAEKKSRMAVISYCSEYSISDQVETLFLSFKKTDRQRFWKVSITETDFISLTITTSFSQYFLTNLVAGNRKESISSVVREAIGLLLDTERIFTQR